MSTDVMVCGPARLVVHGAQPFLDELAFACRPWITTAPDRTTAPPDVWTVRIGPGTLAPPVASRAGTDVRFSAADRTVHLPCPGGPAPVVRVLRALIRRQLAADGALFADAAVVSLPGGSDGIALLGGSCSGKTSTLIAYLHHHRRARLVANDDAVLCLHDGRVTARGLPRAIEVRAESLPHLGAAARALTEGAEGGGSPGALYLRPQMLAAVLDAELTATTGLSALVVLEPGERCALERVEPQAAAEVLVSRLTAADPYETWLDPYLPTPALDLTGQAAVLARTVPVWRLAQPMTGLAQSAGLLAALSPITGGTR
ncbi:hypothetical protein [Streptomyces sp. H39-S7]|uniref:hypothetical protein n=1 Tax=Streptomyces sp. H39-S7 TaxID=3004357 RepID=UPI0022B02D41|nr:hypothetical protein [Streptomyces sp. H39-S7]MCZ4125427.1 hypothetical protein [Streptomyces sp. H39-S7]